MDTTEIPTAAIEVAPTAVTEQIVPTLSFVPLEELPKTTEWVKEEEVPGLIPDIKQCCQLCLDKQGVAVAAPQVGKPHKYFVAISKLVHEGKEYLKFDTLFNPQYKAIKDQGKEEDDEGCLSLPGEAYRVSRYKVVRLTWSVYDGTKFVRKEKKLKGFSARVAQHEIDHLNGFTIKDRGTKVEPKPVPTESVPEEMVRQAIEQAQAKLSGNQSGEIIPAQAEVISETPVETENANQQA